MLSAVLTGSLEGGPVASASVSMSRLMPVTLVHALLSWQRRHRRANFVRVIGWSELLSYLSLSLCICALKMLWR